jgi:hypothetical protein
MAGNYASRLIGVHSLCITTFGKNASGAQLYCWHDGIQITCYEPNRQRARSVVEAALMAEGESVIHATKALFATAPEAGDTIHVGTDEEDRMEYRITDVQHTHIRPFYRLTLIDPNKAETAD